MRNVILTLMAILCLAVVVHADNPDSRPSVSIGVGGSSSTGDYEVLGRSQDLEAKEVDFGLGMKFPISENATIWGNFSYYDRNSKGEENFYFYKSVTEWTTSSFNIGITIYIGDSINK